jgi:trigger factor
LTIDTEFPESHSDARLAGKKAQATLTVTGIKERTLPELDDEFAKEISELETIEALREHIRESFEASARRLAERDLRDQAARAVVEASEVDVPEQLVVDQTKRSMDTVMDELRRRGLTLEQFLRAAQKTTEQLYAEQAAMAREAIRTELVLDAIATRENIVVTDEEVEAEVRRIAEEQEMGEEEVWHELQEHDQLGRIRSRLRTSKTLDFLIENAQVEEVPIQRASERSIIRPGNEPVPEREVTTG